MVMSSFKICLQLSSIKSINVPYFSVLAIQNFPRAVITGKHGRRSPESLAPPPPSLDAYVRMLSIVVSERLY